MSVLVYALGNLLTLPVLEYLFKLLLEHLERLGKHGSPTSFHFMQHLPILTVPLFVSPYLDQVAARHIFSLRASLGRHAADAKSELMVIVGDVGYVGEG